MSDDVFCDAAAEWDHDWQPDPADPTREVCAECGRGAL